MIAGDFVCTSARDSFDLERCSKCDWEEEVNDMPRIGVHLKFSLLSDEMGQYIIHPVHERVMR